MAKMVFIFHAGCAEAPSYPCLHHFFHAELPVLVATGWIVLASLPLLPSHYSYWSCPILSSLIAFKWILIYELILIHLAWSSYLAAVYYGTRRAQFCPHTFAIASLNTEIATDSPSLWQIFAVSLIFHQYHKVQPFKLSFELEIIHGSMDRNKQ